MRPDAWYWRLVKGNRPPSVSNWFSRKPFSAAWVGDTNGFGPGFGFSVRMLWRAKAQTDGGRDTPVKQITLGADELARLAIMASWAAVGRKILVFVSRGTAFCAFCRKPSKATNRNVLSFLIGKPSIPPNC